MENSEVNIASVITQTINSLLSNAFSSIDNTLYAILDDLVFINGDIVNNPNLKNIMGDNSSSGLIMIANSLVFGFLIYYALTYLISHFTFSQIQKPGQLIFKLILCVFAINFSYNFCCQLIYLNATLSLSIRNIGETILGNEICFSALLNNLNSVISLNEFGSNLFSIEGIIKAIISIGLLNLTFSYALRYVMILVFILISPFAFLSLILSGTSWFFKSWLKLFLSLLFLQLLIPIILIIAFSFDYSNEDMLSKLIYLGSIYALIKANSYLKEFMGGLSTDMSLGISSMRSMFTGGNI